MSDTGKSKVLQRMLNKSRMRAGMDWQDRQRPDEGKDKPLPEQPAPEKGRQYA